MNMNDVAWEYTYAKKLADQADEASLKADERLAEAEQGFIALLRTLPPKKALLIRDSNMAYWVDRAGNLESIAVIDSLLYRPAEQGCNELIKEMAQAFVVPDSAESEC